jgi:hypothetical protein
MGKKDTMVSTDVAVDSKFAPLLASLSPEEVQEFAALSDEIKESRLAIFTDMVAASSVEMGDMVELGNAKKNIEIYSAGGPMLRPGTTLRARLHGTVFIKSTEFKENWTELKDDNGVTFFQNHFFQLETVANAHVFGIWSYPTLNSKLEKILTATSGAYAGKDPIVEITYVGKIEGRDVLKQKYNIELKQGNAAHVFIVKAEKSAKVDAYATGCVNPLNNPSLESSNGPKVSRDEATRARYERLMALQSGGSEAVGLLAQ